MGKVISFILSAAVAAGGLTVPAAYAADSETILPSGYVFTDIAHKPGTGIYVAEAKRSADKDYPRVYYSADGGRTWAESASKPLEYTAKNYANANTQNQLEWWSSQNVFVIHGAGVPGVYTSADGNTWTGHENLQYGGNSVIASNGQKLVLVNERKAVAADDTSTVLRGTGALEGYTFGAASYYAKAAAVSSADANGDSVVYVGDKWQSYYLTVNAEGEVTDTQTRYNQFNVDGGQDPYDAVYSPASGQFYAVDGGSGSVFITDKTGMAKRTNVAAGKSATGVAVGTNYVFAGTADGGIYYTANTAMDENTQWTQISTTNSDGEPIKNIAADGDSFVALGTTQIYRGTTAKFANINEPVNDSDQFAGVKLIGGAYSGSKYVVYGNTTDGRGRIYTSADGLNWKQTYDASASFNDSLKNGAVWWQAQNKFIISASTQATTGASVVADASGEHWSWVDSGTGYALNTDFAVGDDGKLYTVNASSAANAAMYKYSSWSADDRETVDLSGISGVKDWMNRIAISDGADPAVLIHYQNAYTSNGIIRNNKSSAADETSKWSGDGAYVQGQQGAGFAGIWNFELLDVVYSKTLDSFVAVSKNADGTNAVTTVIPVTGGSVKRGPRVSTGSVQVTNAIDVNSEVYAYACKDGNVYTLSTSQEFDESSNAKLTAVSPADGTGKNTKPVVNVFGAGSGFIAVSTNGTDSDVLLVEKTASGYEFKKGVITEETQEPDTDPVISEVVTAVAVSDNGNGTVRKAFEFNDIQPGLYSSLIVKLGSVYKGLALSALELPEVEGEGVMDLGIILEDLDPEIPVSLALSDRAITAE